VFPLATTTSAGALSRRLNANTSLPVLYNTAHLAVIEPPDAVHDGLLEKKTLTDVVPVCDKVTLTPPVAYPLALATSPVTPENADDETLMFDPLVTSATL
jgi:hypothetical protein